MDILRKRIHDLREDADITQKQLADKIGITQNAISYYENGRSMPAEVLQKYAEYFGVSIDYLVGATNDPQPTTDDLKKSFDELAKVSNAAGGHSFTTRDIETLIEQFVVYYKAGAPAGNVPLECTTDFLSAMSGLLGAAASNDKALLLDKVNDVAASILRVNDIFRKLME